MSVRIGAGVCTEPDARVAAIEAARTARDGLGGQPADLAVVFAAGDHLAVAEATLEGVHEALMPRELVGCGAAGVLGTGREYEGASAVAVWALALPDGEVETFAATAEGEGTVELEGLPDISGMDALILLPDPYSFPTDRFLAWLHNQAPGLPVLGGLASGGPHEGAMTLFHGQEVLDTGAVGVGVAGVEVLPCVSQGAVPIGPELTITAAEGQVIHELAGERPLSKLRSVVEGLPERQRELVEGGLLMGLVIDRSKPEYGQGDFLVRGLLGADPERGAVAVGAPVSAGQVVRLHVRDADSAARDLRDGLDLRARALGSGGPAGALCFTCNGRGADMFGEPHQDAQALEQQLAGVPAVGFFAAGEIGPVGGENFLHGFTATVAVFGS